MGLLEPVEGKRVKFWVADFNRLEAVVAVCDLPVTYPPLAVVFASTPERPIANVTVVRWVW